MLGEIKKWILMGVIGLAACQSPRVTYPPVPEPDRSFLFPSANKQDIHFLCDSVYSIPQFQSRPFVRSATPQLLVVTESTVTIYFSNDYTQTLAKPSTVRLSPGTYQCL